MSAVNRRDETCRALQKRGTQEVASQAFKQHVHRCLTEGG